MKIVLTDLKGRDLEVEFKEIKGHVGDYEGYSKYRLSSGAFILVTQTLPEVRELAGVGAPPPKEPPVDPNEEYEDDDDYEYEDDDDFDEDDED